MSTVEKSIRLYAWRTNYYTFRIVEGEANSRIFNIQLFSTTISVNLANCHVSLYAVKPDSTKSYIDCEILDAELGLVRVTLTDQIASVEGLVDCWIHVVSDAGTDLRFEGMNIEVSDCDLSEAVESSDEFPVLLTALSEVRPATARANDAADRANKASETADTATKNADAATTKANTATSNADKATSDANTAAKAANDAATSTLEAKERGDFNGMSAYEYAKSVGYTGTEEQFANYMKEVPTMSEEFLELLEQAALTQFFVDSVDDMVDTTKKYVLKSTGRIWEFTTTTIEKPVTIVEEIEATEDNPYIDGSRFASSGDTYSNDAAGYHITPKIDLSKPEYTGKIIKLRLEGARYAAETDEQWILNRAYDLSGNVIYVRSNSNPNNAAHMGAWHLESYEILSQSAVFEFKVPLIYSGSNIPIYALRFCGKGSIASSNISIEYEGVEILEEGGWVDTGMPFGYIVGNGSVDADVVKELNNEGNDPQILRLLPAPVFDFYRSEDYPDNDYTVSHLDRITYPCRADIPVPYTVKWSHNQDAMRTTVAVDTKPVETVNAYTLKTYDATGVDNFPLYNLMPDTIYYYKVTHVLADGSLLEAKSGHFKTSPETVRLIYIDGTQNVRDLGGWTGLNGKKVKYGKIFRGASLSDSSSAELTITGKGRRAMGELKIQAELNLGAVDNETSIAANCSYKKIGYNNYAGAITGATYRAQFKEVLEYIIQCLNGTLTQGSLFVVQRNVYMHCQGGCDRTGTLAFQLLGLLGVSESNLAKEYELSSFSNIGFGRLRTTTKEVNTYDYVGMVQAIKAYSGATISDKFYNFALDCGISSAQIDEFRSLMLE